MTLIDPISASAPAAVFGTHDAVRTTDDIRDAEVREELHRLVTSRDFPATPRNRKFIGFAVERTLQNRGGTARVTAYEVGTQIFGRGPDFNPGNDPIVRIEAARLRKDLETYYLKSGRRNPLRIRLPRGGYDAAFLRPADAEEGPVPVPPATGVLSVDVPDELRRILGSADFPATPRNRRFLSHVTEKELAGAGDGISARSIGMHVFERGAGFNPNSDPIVRIEAGKLRRDLEVYYLRAGRHNPVQISIPKGKYRPVFTYRDAG